MPERPGLILSCEHGGKRVPTAHRALFAGAERALASHRGWDPGALALAEHLAHRFAAPLYASRTTRLLVELNRSPRHPALFSEFSRALDPDERRRVLARHYLPHREALRRSVAHRLGQGGHVLHVAVHTFAPALGGAVRNADLGLLYDPSRLLEQDFCRRWQAELRARLPRLRVRRNYPYRGAADGITTWLRREFPAERYLGLELEVNQRFPLAGGVRWRGLREAIGGALECTLAQPAGSKGLRREDAR